MQYYQNNNDDDNDSEMITSNNNNNDDCHVDDSLPALFSLGICNPYLYFSPLFLP